jgi:hypothetical protein
MPRPRVTQYRVWVCRCVTCGQRVRGGHPDLAPDQYGATAHRVGKRAMAAAHMLHYQIGIPVRKASAVLEALAGLKLTLGCGMNGVGHCQQAPCRIWVALQGCLYWQ